MRLLIDEMIKLDRMYSLLNSITNKYGYYSVAAIIIKYNILSTALEIRIALNKGQSAVFMLELNKAVNLVKDHYSNTKRKKRDSNGLLGRCKSIIKNGQEHYIFDSEYYYEKYKEASEVQHLVAKVTPAVSEYIKAHNFYLYAVNNNMEPIIFKGIIPLREFIEGRKYLKFNDTPIVHPMLLHNYNLTAIGAGEVIFVKNSKNLIKGAIINNKSGHYRPSTKSLIHVSSSFEKSLDLEEDCVVVIEVEGV